MVLCPNCQLQLQQGTHFCPECGAQVDGGQHGGPGPQEQYCPGCGQIVHRQAAACPSCGVQIDASDFNETLWIGGGVLAVFMGFIVLAIVFGPLAVFVGYKVYSERNGLAGPLIMLGGIVDILAWLVFMATVTNSTYYYGMTALPLV